MLKLGRRSASPTDLRAWSSTLRNGKAYAAFPDLGIVKIVTGAAGPVVTLKTGANVKNLTLDPRSGRVYAMNRGPGTISVIDPDTDAIIDTLTRPIAAV